MAFVRTENYTAKNGDVYADVAAWVAAHGNTCMSGAIDHSYTGAHTLLEGGTGIKVVLTYTDEAAHTAHMDLIKSENPSVNLTGSWDHSDAVTCTFVSAV